MDALLARDLIDLAAHRGPWCLSLYMPAYRGGDAHQQNPIRLDNLASQAEEQLVDYGLSRTAAREALDRVRELPQGPGFVNGLSDGLAIFVARDRLQSFRLPIRFEERVVVGDRFHVKPLVPVASGDGQFLVLAVSAKSVRLLEGDRWGLSEQHPPELPQDMSQALNFAQRREEPRRMPSKGQPVEHTDLNFRGPGGTVNVDKDELLEFFHAIDRGLEKHLGGQRLPLVFAGVEHLFPIFKETCSYKYVAEQPVEGNTDTWNVQQLHAAAWAIVEPMFAREREEALEKAHHAATTEYGLVVLEAVVAACDQGQVDTLLVDLGACQWGVMDPQTKEVHLHDQKQADSEDLVDFAVSRTLRNGGRVFAVEAEKLPNHGIVAAVLRYPSTATAGVAQATSEA